MRNPLAFHNHGAYRAYLVFLLATILTLNGLDGTAVGIVLPSIKSALQLTDTELGFLTGIAFSVFYSTVGIPIGRWADRGDRVSIIAATTALWGLMVMLMGSAQTFPELLLIRIGVAVGEAGCVPAAYSLIGEYFAREERSRAVSNYLLGSPLSLMFGYLAAGWLSSRYGWREMFVWLGMPSVVIASLAWGTLTEPRRGKRSPRQAVTGSAGSANMGQVMRVLWGTRTFRYILGVTCVNALFGSGLVLWQPSFFVRSYGMRAEQLGLDFALIYGVAGVIGVYSGGYLASRFAARNETAQLRVFALFNGVFVALSAFIYLSTDAHVSMSLLALAVAGLALETGPIYAITQTVIPERMRAISISVIYLFANLLGAGVGPLIVGALSDALRAHFGTESLRYALLAMSPGYLGASWLLWRATKSVAADTEAAVGMVAPEGG